MPNAQEREFNDWTIMVYLAGDNNLAEEMVYALKCMQLVGSNPPRYKVVAFYDAGLVPTTIEIRDSKSVDIDVKDVGNLLREAEKSRNREGRERILAIKRDLKAARESEDRLEGEANVASAEHAAVTAVARGGVGAPAPLQVRLVRNVLSTKENLEKKNREFRRAIAVRRAAEANLKAANAVKRGGPEVVESVRDTLKDFMIKTIKDHPAHHYMLVLSGHGSGAVGDFLTSDRRFLSLTIPKLGETLAEVQREFRDPNHKNKYLPEFRSGKVDILGMDSCLMGMAEVAYEVRLYVDYLVGTEGFESNTGWPYDRILNLFRRRQAGSPRDLAKDIVREYVEFYSSDYTLAEVSTGLSALELGEKIESFAGSFEGERGLSKCLQQGLADSKVRDAIVLAHWEAQGFKNEQHIDVWDFCDQVGRRCAKIDDSDIAKKIKRACAKTKRTINGTEGLVLASDYCGPAFQHSYGTSIFFPWANITDAAGNREVEHYEKSLAFGKKTKWGNFISAYHAKTQRPPRPRKGTIHLSALNRREGLFTGKPGRSAGPDPDVKSASPDPDVRSAGPDPDIKLASARVGSTKIASMKNPPIKWRAQS